MEAGERWRWGNLYSSTSTFSNIKSISCAIANFQLYATAAYADTAENKQSTTY